MVNGYEPASLTRREATGTEPDGAHRAASQPSIGTGYCDLV